MRCGVVKVYARPARRTRCGLVRCGRKRSTRRRNSSRYPGARGMFSCTARRGEGSQSDRHSLEWRRSAHSMDGSHFKRDRCIRPTRASGFRHDIPTRSASSMRHSPTSAETPTWRSRAHAPCFRGRKNANVRSTEDMCRISHREIGRSGAVRHRRRERRIFRIRTAMRYSKTR